jgi:hypothetical protein
MIDSVVEAESRKRQIEAAWALVDRVKAHNARGLSGASSMLDKGEHVVAAVRPRQPNIAEKKRTLTTGGLSLLTTTDDKIRAKGREIPEIARRSPGHCRNAMDVLGIIHTGHSLSIMGLRWTAAATMTLMSSLLRDRALLL